MSVDLRAVLDDRADAVRLPPPDVHEIVAEAKRRRRRHRRRVTAVVSGVIVLAVVVAGAVAVLGSLRSPDRVGTGGGVADAATWSRGSVIHVGPDRVDVGFAVHGFVRTSSGFAVMDARQSVWSITDAGRRRIGEVGDQRRLVADPHGTLVAWVGPANELVVYDHLAGRSRGFADPSGDPGDPGDPGDSGDSGDGGVLAMDRRTVYWRNGNGLEAVDADTGTVTNLTSDRLQLFDAKNSVLAFSDATRDLKVGTSLEDATPIVAWSLDPHGGDEPVVLSPTGRWAAVAHIRVTGPGDRPDIDAHLNVYDVRTGATTTLRLPGGPWVAVPSVWLGDATLQVLGLFGDPPFAGDTVDPSLFTCRLPSGSCRRAATVGRVGTGFGVATLPDGRWSD